MSTTLFKKFLFVHELFNTTILYLIPKKLRTYISASWYSYSQQQQQQQKTIESFISSTPSSGIQNKMDPNELKRVFELFDKNGDGRITKKELNDSLQNMGIFIADGDLSQMIQKIDVNGDGSVDVDEFGSLYRAIMNEQDVEGDMKEVFSVFDQNGDGFITVDELNSVLASLGIKQGRTAENCKQMIMKVDVDGDGMVNLSEFKRMMRGGGFNALTN